MYTSGGAVEFMPNPYNIVKLGTGLCHRQQNATASPSLRRNSSGMQLPSDAKLPWNNESSELQSAQLVTVGLRAQKSTNAPDSTTEHRQTISRRYYEVGCDNSLASGLARDIVRPVSDSNSACGHHFPGGSHPR